MSGVAPPYKTYSFCSDNKDINIISFYQIYFKLFFIPYTQSLLPLKQYLIIPEITHPLQYTLPKSYTTSPHQISPIPIFIIYPIIHIHIRTIYTYHIPLQNLITYLITLQHILKFLTTQIWIYHEIPIPKPITQPHNITTIQYHKLQHIIYPTTTYSQLLPYTRTIIKYINPYTYHTTTTLYKLICTHKLHFCKDNNSNNITKIILLHIQKYIHLSTNIPQYQIIYTNTLLI